MAASRQTNFVLNARQDRNLTNYCLRRVDSLINDNDSRMKADRFAAQAYENSRNDREAQQGVFEISNLVLPLSSMIVESFISRAEDAILGEDPYFHFRPQAKNDDPVSQQCDAYFRYKFGERQANIRAKLEDGIQQVFLRRATVFKTIWDQDVAKWIDRDVEVLHDRGKVVRIPDTEGGDPHMVTDDDAEWETFNDVDDGGKPMTRSRLKIDKSIVWDKKRHAFAKPKTPPMRSRIRYEGANSYIVDSDAFLCPSTAPSIEKADFKAERYDRDLPWVKKWFIDRPWSNWDDFRLFHEKASAKPKTDIDRNNDSKEDLSFDEKTHSLPLVECWVRRDVLGWGEPQEFMVLIDVEQKKSVYYEFQAKLCPDLKCPFKEVVAARYKGRWFGLNLMEKLKQYQDYVDKQFNRHSVRNALNANPIGGFHADAVEEEPDELELGDGGLFHLKGGKRMQDFIEFATIPNLDLDTTDLINMVREMVQAWLARSNLAQGDTSDIPRDMPNQGIKAALNEGTKIDQRWSRHIIADYTEILHKMTTLQADQLDRSEVYEVTDGNGTELATMTPDQLKKLDVHVQIVMGQKITETDIAAANQALIVQKDYFLTPDPLKAAVRPAMKKILEKLDFKDVDKMLPLPEMPAETAPAAPLLPATIPAAPAPIMGVAQP